MPLELRTDDNHVGMFVSGSPTNFKTIEGNLDSRCARKDRTSQSSYSVVFVHVSK